MFYDEGIFFLLGILFGFVLTLNIMSDDTGKEKECIDYYLKNDYVLSYCEEYIKK